MIRGSSKLFILILFTLIYFKSFAEDKIVTTPLINLNELKPSYENLDSDDNVDPRESKLQERVISKEEKTNYASVNLIGLDKITAKTKNINIKIGETAKFGLLEIKALKCGLAQDREKKGVVAYIQIKDISENQNEKVFIFNGWTFSSNPSLTPIDHAVYDVWLAGCGNV